jgi:transcriptional regulator with XRE-family HTH domain
MGQDDVVAPPVNPHSALLEEVGRRARRIRTDKHLTLDELSKLSGVSRRTIISLEAGEANVSLGILDKLARALGTDFGSLVSERETEPMVSESFTEVSPIWQDETGSSARLLVSYANPTGAEMWSWELTGGARYDADPDPPGSEELILVSSGVLHVEVGGERYPIAAGSYLRLPSDRHYSYVNVAVEPVSFTRLVATRAPTSPPPIDPSSSAAPPENPTKHDPSPPPIQSLIL